MTTKSFSAFMPPIAALSVALCLAGCATDQGASQANFSEVPAPRTASNDASQKISTTTLTAPYGAGASVTYGSNNQDGDLAASVQKMVLSDRKLAPYPSRVTATMDPATKGRVVLTGSVPTQDVKQNIVKRVKALPGVMEVEDKLVVDYPKSSREVDVHSATQ